MSSEDENESSILYLPFLTPFSSLAFSFQRERNLSRADNRPITKAFGLQKNSPTTNICARPKVITLHSNCKRFKMSSTYLSVI
jgi:hypothetical protein